MSTSGTTVFSITRDDIINRALRIMGVIPQGSTGDSNQITEGALALNGVIKAICADGMPLWATKEYSITPVASTRVYRIGEGQTLNTSKPLRIIQAWWRGANLNDVPINILTRQEYNMLSNKFTTGTPFNLYYDVQRTYGDIYLHLVPDATFAANATVYIIYQRPFEDFVSSGNEPDFPIEWFDTLAYSLADRLSLEYGLENETRKDIHMKAMQFHAEVLSMGTEEGSMYFQSDIRERN